MSHRWLIGVSVGAHFAVALGLFASGVWNIERLPGVRSGIELRQPLGMPEASGGPVAARTDPIKPKERAKVVAKGPHQPEKERPVEKLIRSGEGDEEGPGKGDGPTSSTCLENCAPAPTVEPTAVVCGDRSRDLSEQCDDGNTADGDGCSSDCRLEPPPRPVVIAPPMLQGLRISGDTQITPSSATQTMMLRDGAQQVRGIIKLCVGTDGAIAAAQMIGTTKYAEYDDKLLSAVRTWRYRPYMLSGKPVPVCSTVTFIYSMR